MLQVRQLERTVGLKDLTVAEMEGRLREMSATTFDGVFVWRISDFAKKRQDAVAGRAPAMFSPGRSSHSQPFSPVMCWWKSLKGKKQYLTCWFSSWISWSLLSAFYTSKYGYKMCLRIYLNGDGTGRGSHLSLFFVVMRGQSDALLKWPFNQKVNILRGQSLCKGSLYDFCFLF